MRLLVWLSGVFVGVLLRVYPARFRRRFDGAVRAAFEDDVDRAAGRGAAAVLGAWVRMLGDALRSAPAQWNRVGRDHRTSGGGMRTMRIDDVTRELVHAARSLWSRPRFLTAAVLTLGLGIGAAAAVFSVVNGVLLQGLPYEDPDRLVMVWNRLEGEGERVQNSAPSFLDYQAGTEGFEGFAAISTVTSNLTGDGYPALVTTAAVTPNLFSMLGVEAALGRVLLEEDAVATVDGGQAPATASGRLVLSHDLWQSRYGGSGDVVGRTVGLNGQPVEIVGVLPPGFRIHLPPETGVPPRVDGFVVMNTSRFARLTRRVHWVTVLARLQPGVTLDRAQDEMSRLAAEVRSTDEYHARAGVEFEVVPLEEDLVRDARSVLFAFAVAVGLVLLVGCSNVANLVILRTAEREGELAVRTALGSGRARLLLSLLMESAVLGALGCGLGILLAHGGLEVLSTLSAADLPRIEEATMDGRVLGFSLLLSIVAALGVAAVATLQFSSPDPAAALQRSRRGRGGGSSRVRSILVVGQIAFSLVLLLGASLTLRTVRELQAVDPGFEAGPVETFSVSLPSTTYQPDRDETQRAFAEISDQLQMMPRVRRVSAVSDFPLTPGDESGGWALDEGDDEAWDLNRASYRAVLPGYLEIMGIDLLAGRTIEEQDGEYGRPVAVVDEALAARAWGSGDAIGRTLVIQRFREDQRGFERVPAEVVGMVSHVRQETLDAEGLPGVYVHLVQRSRPTMTFAVEAAGGTGGLSPDEARTIVAAVESEAAVHDWRPLRSYLDEALAPSRLVLSLTTVFAVLALALAVVGLFGVVSFAVTARTSEIGLRMALGARREDVVALVVGGGARLAFLGVLVGGGMALVLARVVRTELYGVPSMDLGTLAAATGVLLASALAASLLPALRATRIRPRDAISGE